MKYEIRQHTSAFKRYITRWHIYLGPRQVTRGFETRETAQRWLDSHGAWLAARQPVQNDWSKQP